MELKILHFGVTRDIVGGDFSTINIDGDNVGDLKSTLFRKHPQLKKLRSLLIAVNNEYANDDKKLCGRDEIALIPPVSGG